MKFRSSPLDAIAGVSILAMVCLLRAAPQELLRGFEAAPRPSASAFQPLLTDPTGNFSLSLLRVNGTMLALAVVHVRSSQPLWVADPDRPARWSDRSTRVSFNGSLVVSDPSSGVFWSTGTDGDRVVLLNSSNLQVQKQSDGDGGTPVVLWQSFDFPADTLVENQNFTAAMSLASSNGLYSMRMGSNFFGLYAKFDGISDQMYWEHKALEAKAQVVDGAGAVYARVDPDGFVAMYQNSSVPVDVEAFNSFQKRIDSFLLLRLESDGNLKGYYWTGSTWAMNYRAISGFCELPSPCGPYSLCSADSTCACLDNRTEARPGSCSAPGSSDFCGGGGGPGSGGFSVLRRNGVELPFKELMGYVSASSLDECERACKSNCSCWGAVYSNTTQFCYTIDYPIQTLVEVADETKIGYFKVKPARGEKGKAYGVGFRVGVLMWVLIGFVVACGFGLVGYRAWRRRMRLKGHLADENGLAAGPYKDLGSASFRSIELSSR
ncbi:PAN domain-containing protein At5g03700 [Rhodamnia argentea]|uniref:PAN domain-containing protein At5g03700 n=1 Tax=Rhodamnia argentea TaxID=178133 RepID=A0A8B8NI61_9MYRT|nr:PAN domain-containing protein At5g03700 [Rhodamnia argentea]